MSNVTGIIRDISPCKGCEAATKKPGCHDACREYGAWRREVERVKENRKKYDRLPFSKIL